VGIYSYTGTQSGCSYTGLGHAAEGCSYCKPDYKPSAATATGAIVGAIIAGVADSKYVGRKSFTGTAYEFKHVNKHLEGTPQSARVMSEDGTVHVFTTRRRWRPPRMRSSTTKARSPALYEGRNGLG
jgi:hypothetical protein